MAGGRGAALEPYLPELSVRGEPRVAVRPEIDHGAACGRAERRIRTRPARGSSLPPARAPTRRGGDALAFCAWKATAAATAGEAARGEKRQRREQLRMTGARGEPRLVVRPESDDETTTACERGIRTRLARRLDPDGTRVYAPPAKSGSIMHVGDSRGEASEGARAPRSSRGEQLREPGDPPQAARRGPARDRRYGAVGKPFAVIAAPASALGDDKTSFHRHAPLNFFHELRRRGPVTTKTKQRRPGMGGAAPPNSSA